MAIGDNVVKKRVFLKILWMMINGTVHTKTVRRVFVISQLMVTI